jgi:hypothetical protein
MLIEKCDLCEKELEKGNHIKVGYNRMFPQYTLCDDCGAPVAVFLKDHALVGKAQ